MNEQEKRMNEPVRLFFTQCAVCKHYFKDGYEGSRCPAFPNGIPDDILYDHVSHKAPYEGDNGIQFEADKELLTAYLKA